MRIFTLVQWTFGFLATSARTKDEIRLKFEAITLKDVKQVAFLVKAVRCKKFQIKEAITFDSYHLWG